MLRMRSFALVVPALLLATAFALAAPPGYVSPPNTYHYPSARDFISPANRTTSHYFAPPESYYLHPDANPEPNVAPQYSPAQGTTSPADAYGYDVPLVPRVLRERAPPTPAPAEIEVRVPAGAELWFSGEKTRQTGTRRLFLSPPLEPGNRYAYDVKARWTEDGKAVERSVHVPVTAGAHEQVTIR